MANNFIDIAFPPKNFYSVWWIFVRKPIFAINFFMYFFSSVGTTNAAYVTPRDSNTPMFYWFLLLQNRFVVKFLYSNLTGSKKAIFLDRNKEITSLRKTYNLYFLMR